jgi:leucyl-tRNA synthetase
MSYDHKNIDKKWQDAWEGAKIFHAEDDSKKDPYYLLVEFPYPSGAGLHLGHPRSYTALDVIARKKRMDGMNVLYPMGWDAFGLPTENFAIKTGRKPQEVTVENIKTFKRQLQSLGLSFDWSREVNTTDPAYYKWTQWMFNQFFKAGLAYKAKTMINWCPSCKIGLANEEVVAGNCERCGSLAEKREKEQWMIKITEYADRLIDDLDTVDYLPKIKKQQVDWIGRSEGAKVRFEVDGSDDVIEVFTTRPDTLFGATYMVLAPEHELVSKIVTDDQSQKVGDYIREVTKKSDIERGDGTKEKTGVDTGAFVINPVNGEKIPVWVADYVLMGYGTGAIMAVPGHDERDHAFAKQFGLPIVEVISGGGVLTEVYVGDGALVNSEFLNGLKIGEAKTKMIAWLEEKGAGEKTKNYRLRDWVFSRQRYWGEPIPLVHCESCSPETDGWIAVPDDQLPVALPEVEKYEPTDDGESPLAAMTDWVKTTCPSCGGEAQRETDTMPNWAGSSWYFLRYIDPKNDEAFASADKLKYWMPVNLYNGGMEHTTLHLLYSRFWNKFLFDQGHVPVSEPYVRRHSHGLILADDGTKMSKSKGNVINPDEIVGEFGADTLRVYELFIGPFEEPVPWKRDGLIGVKKFLDRVMRLDGMISESEDETVTRALHKAVKKVTEDIEGMKFNTPVASMMEFVNAVNKAGSITKETLGIFLRVLCPFAPHVANELASRVGTLSATSGVLEAATWPTWDETMLIADEVEIAVQVNGKLRGTVTVSVDIGDDELKKLAKEDENVAKYLTSEMKKVIVVPGKLVNFVI